jgi:hypothetical protein
MEYEHDALELKKVWSQSEKVLKEDLGIDDPMIYGGKAVLVVHFVQRC